MQPIQIIADGSNYKSYVARWEKKAVNLKTPFVILQNSPKINLERLIKRMQPIQIIADGSNYKSYVARWEKKAVNLKTPFHYTGQNGAFTY
jgi:competence protein ComEC